MKDDDNSPTERTCLFIGGKSDGRRIKVDRTAKFWKVAIEEKSPIGFPPRFTSDTIQYKKTVETEVFRRVEFAQGSDRYFVYIHDQLPEEDALWHLIRGYRTPPP